MTFLCHSENKKNLLSNENENNHCIIETWKKLKYKKAQTVTKKCKIYKKSFVNDK